MIRLGIVAALPGEVRTLTKHSLTPGNVYPLDREVLLVWSGIGSERARRAAEQLLDRGARALLSWGCAAALREPLIPGNLVLPDSVVTDDRQVLPVDPGWHERLHAGCGGRFPTFTGALAETRTVLTGLAEKRALAEGTGAIAADMESAAIGAMAHRAGVPFAVIRAIADSLDMAVPSVATGAIDGHGRLRPLGLLARLFRHPREWPALGRLGRGFRAATATLAGVATVTRSGWLNVAVD